MIFTIVQSFPCSRTHETKVHLHDGGERATIPACRIQTGHLAALSWACSSKVRGVPTKKSVMWVAALLSRKTSLANHTEPQRMHVDTKKVWHKETALCAGA